MKRTAQDILNFVEDNDVKFAKLTFCDIFGNQKNVSLFASELPRAFAEGVSFDGSSIAGFMNVEESDLVLWPDPDTATVLPWRPTEGRVIRMYCDITLPNGKPFEGNCRGYLQSVIKRARAMGLTMLGEKLSADKAESWGLIWKAVPDEELANETMAMARHFASAPLPSWSMR